MKVFFNFLLGVFFLLLLCSCSGFNKIVASKDYNFKLKKANQFFEEKKYEKAQILYQDIVGVYKATDQYEFIFYRMAQCSYLLKDNFTAQMLFKEYLSKFPQSDKTEEIDFKYALSHFIESPHYSLDQGSTVKAMNLMQLHLNNYPNSPLSKEGLNIIQQCKSKLEAKDYYAAMLYYNAGQYKAAAIYFNQLVNDFPDSEKAEDYKFKVVECLFTYANMSIVEKQKDRFEDVLTSYEDFLNRFPESKYIARVKNFADNSALKLKNIKHEQYTAKGE